MYAGYSHTFDSINIMTLLYFKELLIELSSCRGAYLLLLNVHP